jgi:hypothetical protein
MSSRSQHVCTVPGCGESFISPASRKKHYEAQHQSRGSVKVKLNNVEYTMELKKNVATGKFHCAEHADSKGYTRVCSARAHWATVANNMTTKPM